MALIRAHLYARFPIPAVVKVAEPDPHDDLLPRRPSAVRAAMPFYGAAVEFLADEGYLRYGSVRSTLC